MKRVTIPAVISAIVFLASVVLANRFIVHGFPWPFTGLATPTPFGTFTIPVGFGLLAPAGVVMAALALPARDMVQRSAGRWVGLCIIPIGALLSWWVSSPTIAIASGVTFAVAELVDWTIFTPLQGRIGLPKAMLIAGLPAAAVDSALFLYLAGLPLGHGGFAGLMLGKAWVLLIAFPIMAVLRKVVPNKDSALASHASLAMGAA